MSKKDQRTFMGTVSFESGRGNTMRIKFPEVVQPFRIRLKPDNSKVRKGIYGFDSIPDKTIVTSDYTALTNEYKPLAEKILGEEYIPHWISLRKEQVVELTLDWKKKSAAEDYTTVAFEKHPDFTYEPENLIGAKTVKIKCTENNPNPAQLLIKADDELIVGAINVFYPKPKSIELDWCFVEIQGKNKKGNLIDNSVLKYKIDKSKIEKYLKKGLNPALIDVAVSNNEAIIVDISKYTKKLEKEKHLRRYPDNIIGRYIERNRAGVVFSYFSEEHNADANKITVYFINQKCIRTKDIQDDGTYKSYGGLSPTGEGIAYLVLDPDGNIKSENIIHETLHALGLKHTFEGVTHNFKKRKTDNYMDHENSKERTYKWQWDKLHKYKKLK